LYIIILSPAAAISTVILSGKNYLGNRCNFLLFTVKHNPNGANSN
jgi:hypothetical protein